MTTQEMTATIEELQELRRMQEELTAEVEALQDKIKAHMTAQGVDALTAGPWKVSYKAVTSSRLDAAALRAAWPEIAKRFTKEYTARRFCVK